MAATQAACARGWTDSRLWVRARAERTQNMLLMVVTLDVSKLSGWLNALAPCRVQRRACDAGKRCGPRSGRALGVAVTQAARARGGRARLKAGKRARAERTRNISCMVVTLDVSQLEMSALKLFKPLKRKLMSVMAETSHSAIGPYVAMAAVGLALYAWTAVCREALFVNV